MPITTFQQTYGTHDSVSIYARGSGDAAGMDRAENDVRVLMRARRHDAPGSEDDFELETNDTYMDIWKQFTAIFFDVVVGIAAQEDKKILDPVGNAEAENPLIKVGHRRRVGNDERQMSEF